MAVGAGLGAAQSGQFLAHQGRVCLPVAPLHVGDDALERVLLGELLALRCTGVHHVAELDLFVTRPVQDDLLHRLRQGFKRLFDVELVVLGQALQHGEVIAVAPVPALDGATGQTEGGERHHACRVKKIVVAQAVAGRAGAHR